jgi:ATP-dependent DNA ligase
MVSDPNAFYEEGVRTNSHLKLKRAYDADFEVVDFKKGDADGSLVVKSRDVKNPIVANVKYHGELYDVCKGCVVTVRFTEALDTSLKSPRLVSLRIDKDIADSKIEIKASKPFIRVN